jgi:hypothetical protein
MFVLDFALPYNNASKPELFECANCAFISNPIRAKLLNPEIPIPFRDRRPFARLVVIYWLRVFRKYDWEGFGDNIKMR